MIHSNPYFDAQPNLDKPLVKQAESFSTRIRDTFTYFIFYHKKKTFAVMGQQFCVNGKNHGVTDH